MALIYPQTYTAVNIGSTSAFATLPQVIAADSSSNSFLKPCDQTWNNARNRQLDEKYYIPVPTDQLFYIQTAILHIDGATYMTPATGWGDWIFAEVLDDDDVSLSTDYTTFTTQANNIYSSSQDKNFQTLEIDPALIASDKFYFKITTSNGVELCSERFEKKSCDILKFESTYPSVDCYNHFYGEATFTQGDVFEYRNIAWLDARIQYRGNSVARELFDDNFVNPITTTSNVTDLYRVQMLKKIPPFYRQFLVGSLLGGQRIYVDDVEFIGTDITIENLVTAGNMFLGQFDVEKRCESEFNCF